uniref:Uncharacterized protein n=1 Tax=Lactuca sativa TaxID=4236 RepID=A0A9R1UCT2_LACSA|nr:hypothetical protein LSAT_V11C900477130 [Lactuca sativa]
MCTAVHSLCWSVRLDFNAKNMGVKCHHLLCHYLMCKEFTSFDPVDLEELLFSVGDYQIWIMETFPNNSIVGSPIPGVIPQAIAYPRMRRLHVAECECILDVTDVYSLVHLIIYKLP